MSTTSTAQQTPKGVRRCSACGIDLHGKVSYPIAHLNYCSTLHCLSQGFVDNIHLLEPSERNRITKKVHELRCQNIRKSLLEMEYEHDPV